MTRLPSSALSTLYASFSQGKVPRLPISESTGELVKIQMLGFFFIATIYLMIRPTYLRFDELPRWFFHELKLKEALLSIISSFPNVLSLSPAFVTLPVPLFMGFSIFFLVFMATGGAIT